MSGAGDAGSPLEQVQLSLLRRLAVPTYDGGVNGTCYECPFASPPLERDGREANWRDIRNDPTEAYFRCSLPGRDNDAVVWGEYAPCTPEEWFDGVVVHYGSQTEEAP